jgi:hypothetical protein
MVNYEALAEAWHRPLGAISPRRGSAWNMRPGGISPTSRASHVGAQANYCRNVIIAVTSAALRDLRSATAPVAAAWKRCVRAHGGNRVRRPIRRDFLIAIAHRLPPGADRAASRRAIPSSPRSSRHPATSSSITRACVPCRPMRAGTCGNATMAYLIAPLAAILGGIAFS